MVWIFDVCMCVYVCLFVCGVSVSLCVYGLGSARLDISPHMCMCMCMCARGYVCMFMCMCVCVYVCVCLGLLD